jgi:hypothetical protein
VSALSVYIAAPYEDASYVRMVSGHLRRLGLTTTSSWSEQARGPEDLTQMMPAVIRTVAHQNDDDLRAADVCLVMARRGAGGEMFAEARLALEWGKPVYWVGRRILSAYRSGVTICDDLDAAVLAIYQLAAGQACTEVAP